MGKVTKKAAPEAAPVGGLGVMLHKLAEAELSARYEAQEERVEKYMRNLLAGLEQGLIATARKGEKGLPILFPLERDQYGGVVRVDGSTRWPTCIQLLKAWLREHDGERPVLSMQVYRQRYNPAYAHGVSRGLSPLWMPDDRVFSGGKSECTEMGYLVTLGW